jgi:DNA repair exonuclease SbcCD ATPase subunit
VKITALRLFNVKRFAGRGVAIENIGDGVNVLCAANEFGKSTSFEALHALFFQPHSGTPKAVQALRPYSGGNPLVEADIQTETGHFRIRKQFYGQKSVRVTDLVNDRIVAQADEAERFITDLVRGGTAGPAGLLWVRQGMTGIERRSASEEESEKQVRASLLESVQGEVEAVTGGRRMADIMAATEQALGQLVTATGRPKAGERYAAAIEERDRLEAEERRLSAEVTALRQALDQRAAAEKRLQELDRADDHLKRQKDIEAAEAAFQSARSRADHLRTLEAELDLLREKRERASREHAEFRAALERRADLRSKMDTAESHRREAIARRDGVEMAVAKARQESDIAEQEEQEARALLARLDAALAARQAAEQLAEHEGRLASAETLRTEIEASEAALALLKVPDATISALEALEPEIAGLRAVAEAARPSVAVAYEPQAPAVTLDGEPLAEGQARGFGRLAQLAIPGIGIVTLRSHAQAGDDDRMHKAEETRRGLLAALGVPDLAAARQRQDAARRAESDLRERKTRLSLLAPDGLPALRKVVAGQREAIGQALEVQEDPALVRAVHAAAEAKRLAARQASREAEAMQAGASHAVVAAETAFARLDAELKQVEAVLGPEAMRADREQQRAAALADLDAQLTAKRATVEALRAEAVDVTAAEATLRRLRSIAQAVGNEVTDLRKDIAAFSAEIRARSDDAVEEKWRQTVEALSAARARATGFEREVALLLRLRKALDDARSRARDTYLGPVMSELRPLLGLLFDDVAITFDEKTLLPHTLLRNGQEEEVERLSGGMREQLSVLTRLAFARLLARNGRPAPVILDDALVYSDDDRIEKMFDALHRQARDQQILVFSCRQRAFQQLGGHVLRMTDWTPGQH